MDRYIVIYPNNGIVLRNKKEDVHIHHKNINASQKNSAELKKPDKEEHIVYDSIYIKV